MQGVEKNIGHASGGKRVKEYETLTHASLCSKPTVTVLLCDSSSAWYGPTRIWVKREETGKKICSTCGK